MTLVHMAFDAKYSVDEIMAQETNFGKGFLFSGHGAAWAKDLGGNVLQRGCFLPSLKDRLEKRMIKIRWMHYEPMGFVIEGKEDDVGLWIKAFVPNTVTNSERIALMQAGVVDKLSVGFDPDFSSITYTENERKIGKLTLYEVSPVDLPLNEETGIDTVEELQMGKRKFYAYRSRRLINKPKRTYEAMKDNGLPFADLDTEFDEAAALGRVKEFYSITDAPSEDFDNCFLYRVTDSTNIDDRKLLIVDIVDTGNGNEPLVIPAALESCAMSMMDSAMMDGMGISSDDLSAMRQTVSGYYSRMAESFDDPSLIPPWDESSQSETPSAGEGASNKEGESLSKGKKVEKFIGATLNSANYALLKQAHDNVGKVLASATKEDNENELESVFENVDWDDLIARLKSLV